MQNNAILEKVASDLLAAVEYIKRNPKQTESKNYVQAFLKFLANEVAQIQSPSFRKFFKDCGNVVVFRKYCYFTSDFNIKYEYEARFLRFGLNIIVRSDNLRKLKAEFIKAVNAAYTDVN